MGSDPDGTLGESEKWRMEEILGHLCPGPGWAVHSLLDPAMDPGSPPVKERGLRVLPAFPWMALNGASSLQAFQGGLGSSRRPAWG